MDLFAKNVKFLREIKGWKQSEMLDKSGFSPTTWNNYEKGKSKPHFDDLIKISKLFEVSETDLIHTDLEKGKVMPSSTGDEFHKKGKVIGKVLGKVIGKDDEAAKWKSAYENLQKEMKSKDEIIRQKEETIEALRGQVEALKLATRAMEAQVLSNDKSHRKAG